MEFITTLYTVLIETLKDELVQAGAELPQVRLDRPTDFSHGDLTTNVALQYAKRLGANPRDLGQRLADRLTSENIPGLKTATIAGPGFLNITFGPVVFQEILETVLSVGPRFGDNQDLLGETWVVEHTSPNPNKAMHLGHLRNNLVGMSLIRILAAGSANVLSEMVDNNRGIAIAKAMYGFLVHMRNDMTIKPTIGGWMQHPDAWKTPQEVGLQPDVFVTNCYVLAEQDFKSNPDVEAEIRQMVVDWEAGDTSNRKLWQHILNYSYQGIDRTLRRLGNYFDHVAHEHEHYQKGKDLVLEGLEKGLFTKTEDGAVVTNLDAAYGLPDTVLLKRDGTSLYITQDLALTAERVTERGADKLIWVVGPEQSLAMKQMFAACEQLGIGKLSDFTHVAYGYVGLRDEKTGGFKKMSSRQGTVMLIDDLLDEVKGAILTRMAESGREINQDIVAEKLAIAAVKFSLLKADKNLDLVFDITKATDTKGDSGVYVLYAYVRCQSILRKAGVTADDHIVANQLPDAGQDFAGQHLARLLLFYPQAIRRAQQDLSAHHVTQYILELASELHRWYANTQILDGAPDQAHKLAVIKAVAQTLKHGLGILGIEVVEEL